MGRLDPISIGASLPDAALAGRDRAAELHGKTGLEDEVVALFEQFRDRLLRYLLALRLDAHEAEEIVQEVFLALFQHLRGGKPRHNLRAWMFRVAHNLGLKRRQAMQQTVAMEHTRVTRAADAGLSPEEQLLASERRERLQAVVRALPEQDRWCLHLRAEGLRYREIAEALDMSLGAVSLSLGRSLARLARVDGR